MEHNIANRQSNMETQSVSMVIGGQHKQEHSKLTKVLIQYPGDWKKAKHFKDGDIRNVAIETANQFVQSGFGTIITDDTKVDNVDKSETKKADKKPKAKP